MEASRVREEEERKAKERRRATIYERKELNIDRSVADENAVQRASDSTASVQGPTFTSIRSTTSVQGPMFTSKYAVLHQRRCKDPSCKYSRVQVRSTASETLQGPIVQVLTCTSTQYCIRDAARTHRASANVYKYSVLHQRRCKDPSCKYSRVQVLSTASETLQGTIVQVLTCTSTQYCIRDAARTHRASANVYKYTVLHLCTRTPFR